MKFHIITFCITFYCVMAVTWIDNAETCHSLPTDRILPLPHFSLLERKSKTFCVFCQAEAKWCGWCAKWLVIARKCLQLRQSFDEARNLRKMRSVFMWNCLASWAYGRIFSALQFCRSFPNAIGDQFRVNSIHLALAEYADLLSFPLEYHPLHGEFSFIAIVPPNTWIEQE